MSIPHETPKPGMASRAPDFGETRPMHIQVAPPGPDGEPPAWTLPGELAHLAKPPSARTQARRGGREPGAPERRRHSRPAPLGSAAVTRPDALAAACRPPQPVPAARAATEGPSENTLRRTLVACAAGLVALMLIGWWLLNRTDVEVPSSAIVTPTPPAAPRPETIVRDELAVPMPSAPLPRPVAPVVTAPTAPAAARPAATAPTTPTARKAAPSPRQAAKPLSCSELLTRQSLGDTSTATRSALQRCH